MTDECDLMSQICVRGFLSGPGDPDMGRCGNVAFCAMVLFYCSFITGDYLCVSSAADVSSSPHSSVKRRNGVTEVNMTSTPRSDQTQSSTNITNSTEPTPHTDTTTDNSKASTDPLLAGLVSAFVVVAAIVSVLIFLKFRNTNDGPEFRRLQDLPMDDMLEDAPLSMYSY
ncbi:hypothetical protein cypCar_00020648 [Cyprinus carpio]|nr:hypothetical protein cypCar_00020648 [Cyprinus carpio]